VPKKKTENENDSSLGKDWTTRQTSPAVRLAESGSCYTLCVDRVSKAFKEIGEEESNRGRCRVILCITEGKPNDVDIFTCIYKNIRP